MLNINLKPVLKPTAEYRLEKELTIAKKLSNGKFIVSLQSEDEFNKLIEHMTSDDSERGYYFITDEDRKLPVIDVYVRLKDGNVYAQTIDLDAKNKSKEQTDKVPF